MMRLPFCTGVFLLAVYSCASEKEPCPTAYTDRYNLTADQKDQVPYSGRDTMLFTSSAGDSVQVAGFGIDSTYDVQTNVQNNCDYGTRYYEKNTITFSDPANKLYIKTSLNLYDVNTSYYTGGGLDINFQNVWFSCMLTDLNSQFYADTVVLSDGPHAALQIMALDSSYLYYNTVEGILKCELHNGKTWHLKR